MQRCACILAFIVGYISRPETPPFVPPETHEAGIEVFQREAPSLPSQNDIEITQKDIADFFLNIHGLKIKEIDPTIPKYKQSLYEPVALPSINIQQPPEVCIYFTCLCLCVLFCFAQNSANSHACLLK